MTGAINWTHIQILIGTYLRNVVRGGAALIYLLLLFMSGLFISGGIMDPLLEYQRSAHDEFSRFTSQDVADRMFGDEALLERIDELVLDFLEVEPDSEFGLHLRDTHPGLLSALFLMLTFLIPVAACLVGFNQVAGDINTKGLRYILLRTERSNILVARLVGTLLFHAASMFVLIVILIAYITFTFDVYSLGALLVWGLYGWVALMVLALPFVLLCTWVNTWLASPMGSLMIALLLSLMPLFFFFLLDQAIPQADLSWLVDLLPWGWRFELFHPDPLTVLSAVGVMVGWSALLFVLALRRFNQRDL